MAGLWKNYRGQCAVKRCTRFGDWEAVSNQKGRLSALLAPKRFNLLTRFCQIHVHDLLSLMETDTDGFRHSPVEATWKMYVGKDGNLGSGRLYSYDTWVEKPWGSPPDTYRILNLHEAGIVAHSHSWLLKNVPSGPRMDWVHAQMLNSSGKAVVSDSTFGSRELGIRDFADEHQSFWMMDEETYMNEMKRKPRPDPELLTIVSDRDLQDHLRELDDMIRIVET